MRCCKPSYIMHDFQNRWSCLQEYPFYTFTKFFIWIKPWKYKISNAAVYFCMIKSKFWYLLKNCLCYIQACLLIYWICITAFYSKLIFKCSQFLTRTMNTFIICYVCIWINCIKILCISTLTYTGAITRWTVC